MNNNRPPIVSQDCEGWKYIFKEIDHLLETKMDFSWVLKESSDLNCTSHFEKKTKLLLIMYESRTDKWKNKQALRS